MNDGIVVVLPAYNESIALPRLLDRLKPVVSSLPQPLHVIIVDDGSSDGTAEAAERAKGDLSLQVVRHAINRGLHAAIDTGFRAALDIGERARWIVTMDADDTHPPSLIPRMIEVGERGASIVIASRFESGAEWHGLTWNRLVFSHGVSRLFRLLWPMRGVRDYTSGYRAYRAELLRHAYAQLGARFINETSFACMPDILWKLNRLGFVATEVPLPLHYDRKPGPSKMNVARTIRRTLTLIVRRRLGL
jgi:dolichol-phosphate mannosyltransferase